jgi:hypothetical protein
VTATETLRQMSRKVYEERQKVEREFSTMAKAAELMARHNVSRIDDAMHEEAKHRVFAR